jgi:hypothetical protein
MTKTFTAKEMHYAPARVFREADKNGQTKINHAHYPDKIFILTAIERRTNFVELTDGK